MGEANALVRERERREHMKAVVAAGHGNCIKCGVAGRVIKSRPDRVTFKCPECGREWRQRTAVQKGEPS